MEQARVLVALALVGLLGTQSAAQTTADPGCGQLPADIEFLLDASGSVGAPNFQKQLDFIKHFADSFNIGPNAVQVGVTTFASNVKNEFWLNQNTNKADLLKAIQAIHYTTGSTQTGAALKFVRENAFTKPHGDRDKVANILIVMTDGGSTVPAATKTEAEAIHKTNIDVFTIGIGTSINKNELSLIASKPDHVFTVQNFDALSSIQASLKQTACQIDGRWSNWGFYSPCTKSCGGGTQFRERTCSNPPPSHGGKACEGVARESQACGTSNCPTQPPPTIQPPTTVGTTTTNAPGCGPQPADILFILDASGSVGDDNFKKMLTFVQTMAQGFDIGPQSTQVSVITFDTKVYLQFHLNKYASKNDLINAISKIPYTKGITNTHLALEYASGTSFTNINGMRDNAAHIAIVITDGHSNVPPSTASEASKLRAKRVSVFSVGVGSGPDQTELKNIASDPASTHVFVVTDFDALKLIKGSLQQKACEVKPTMAAATQPPQKKNCGGKADIVFLLDESGSVGKANYDKMLTFVKDVANHFTIGPNDVLVGVDSFSTLPHSKFQLKDHQDQASLQKAIGAIVYGGGNTRTDLGLNFLHDDSFTAAAGNRPNVPDIAIVVTDGNSNDRPLTVTASKKLKDTGVKVVAIGVGNGINDQELKTIASDPDSQYVYRASSFDALAALKDLLATKACDVAQPQPQNQTTPLPRTCGAQADIAFLLDGSGSIGASNYNLLLNFVKSIVKDFPVASDKVRVAIETFSSRPYLQFLLNKYTDTQSVEAAVDQIKYPTGATNTADAIKYLKENVFNTANGDRPGVPNIAIIITDGQSNQPDKTKTEAKLLRDAGATVFSVGVGSGISRQELNEMASDPDDQHVMTVDNYANLGQIKALFQEKACQAIPATLPPYEPTGAPSHPIGVDPCQDKISNCNQYAADVCTTFYAWANANCQRHCGFCATSIPTIPPPCVDKLTDCQAYDMNSCHSYKEWAQDNCRKYCGYCATTTYVGFNRKCYYNGKEYNQGESWEDGCAYECTCDNADIGRYSCINKCPAYYNLPPQCTLVKTGECCLKPVCDFDPKYQTTTGQNIGTLNGLDVCVYDGKKFFQGQTWQVGCESECICQDASRGLWSCQSVCPQYGTLPADCRLQQTPGECCAKPVCEFHGQYGTFNGHGTISGPGDNAVFTPPPPCQDKLANCASFESTSCSSVDYREWALANCRKHCDLCEAFLQPDPKHDTCVYQGVRYLQGQRWVDGCQRQCVCEDGKYGYYRCDDNCPQYINLPTGCTLVKAAGTCCDTLKCPGGVFVGSQTIPNTIGGYPIPFPVATPAPGHSGAVPSLAPNLVPQKIDGCMYKGNLYRQGLRWQDTCDSTCECLNGQTGQYRCQPRCPTFPDLPAGCTLVDSSTDPCCKLPDCPPTYTNGTVIVLPVPHYGPGYTGYGPAVYPVGYGTGPSGSNPGGSNPGPTVPGMTGAPISGSRQGCYYKNTVYLQNQRWDDGCEYSCECTDAQSGIYRCTEKCVRYTNLPPNCHMVQDPQNQCCQVPVCDASFTTLAPIYVQTQPPQGSDYCSYKGQYYRQGEEWDDGCSLQCRCEDSQNNYHQCTDRCPSFSNVPLGCNLVPDPRDPQCCKVPECDTIQSSVTGTYQPIGLQGSFTGYGRPDGATIGTTSAYRNACLFKGQIYQQGQTWQDGCSLDCECINSQTGMYRCTDRCPRYAALPSTCTLISDPVDQCCQKATCAPPSNTACVDKRANCYLYGEYACRDPYTAWAKDNCAQFCGFCGGQAATVSTAKCQDQIPNCQEYSKDACVGNYENWARYNCPQYCGYCGGNGLVTTRNPINIFGSTGSSITGSGSGTSGNCQDAISNCQQYTQAACTDPYTEWAKKNCPRYCSLCDQLTGSGGVIGGSGGGFTGVGSVTQSINFVTGFNVGCYYKGQVYSQGEQWVDGCDYNCTCTNSQTGYYRCTSRCPTYQLTDNRCTLITPPGECCAQPVCTQVGTAVTGIGSMVTQAGNGFGCEYKGTFYNQGQEWSDGCQYTCNCVDGARGFYQCRGKCVTWNLPAECHLNEPAAGKCCKTPNCPVGFQVNYPPGYKEE